MKKQAVERCCGEPNISDHPDHRAQLHRLNRIAGQLEGVKRMIGEREYCPDIIVQIRAVRAALKSLEGVLLEKHLSSCVMDALHSDSRASAQKKMEELMELFRQG